MEIDQIIRSHRKTIALIVRRDGKLIVRAPHRTPTSQILVFVQAKSGWIREKQAEAHRHMAQNVAKMFMDGETFLFLGDPFPLKIHRRTRPTLVLEHGHFLLGQNALPRAKETFIAWYRRQAHQVIAERVQYYATLYHLTFQQVKITSARTRWGSCSSRGTLSFTWRLVMAPLSIIDYVVIHELAHLVVKNHSNPFWEKVGEWYGDYAKPIAWLKANGPQLRLE